MLTTRRRSDKRARHVTMPPSKETLVQDFAHIVRDSISHGRSPAIQTALTDRSPVQLIQFGTYRTSATRMLMKLAIDRAMTQRRMSSAAPPNTAGNSAARAARCTAGFGRCDGLPEPVVHLGSHRRRADPGKQAQGHERGAEPQPEGAEHGRVVDEYRRPGERRAAARARCEAHDAVLVRPGARDDLNAAADRQRLAGAPGHGRGQGLVDGDLGGAARMRQATADDDERSQRGRAVLEPDQGDGESLKAGAGRPS